jgi:BirA family transcriptional regulator, biotin operon repressor / biotin---[acetyl-CoA-carboxylase] ligase
VVGEDPVPDAAMTEVPDRPPLDGAALAEAVIRPGGLWREIRVVASTGSTNADVAAAAREGEPEGLVVVAEAQDAGRGRFDRHWVSPPRAGLTFSVLLRPGAAVPLGRWSWIPLLAGLSACRAVAATAGVPAALKWPNDLLVGEGRRKGAGLLVQAAGDAVVLGIGLNVTTTAAELPEGATSLAIEGAATTERERLLRALLEALAEDYLGWRAAGGEPGSLLPAYLAVCDTVGRQIRVSLPQGDTLDGLATTVDDGGRLVVRTADGERAVSAGDVKHVRPA